MQEYKNRMTEAIAPSPTPIDWSIKIFSLGAYLNLQLGPTEKEPRVHAGHDIKREGRQC